MNVKEKASCTYELTLVATTCTRPVKAQTRQNPSTEGGGGDEVPPLAEEPLVTESSEREEANFL